MKMNNLLRPVLRQLARRVANYSSRAAAACAAAVVAAYPAIAAAQKSGGAGIDAQKGATEPSYVAPYFLVVLAVALGLMVVCRPSRRKDPSEKDNTPA